MFLKKILISSIILFLVAVKVFLSPLHFADARVIDFFTPSTQAFAEQKRSVEVNAKHSLSGVFADQRIFTPSGQEEITQKEVQEEVVKVHLFYVYWCPVCDAAKEFLTELRERYPDFEVIYYSLYVTENIDILRVFAEKTGMPQKFFGSVPTIFIGERYFVGFGPAIARGMESYIQYQVGLKELIELPQEPKKVNILFIGKIDIKNLSLPALAIVLGFVDGMNVCALSALILILSMVIGLRSRKKILFYGGLFILVSGITYGLLVVMWLFFFELLGAHIGFLREMIGVLAFLGGGYFFYRFLKFRKRGLVCEMEIGKGIKTKLTERVKMTLKNSKNILLPTAAIITFAFVVTLIQFPCAAMIPLLFTGILVEAQVAVYLQFFYIALFILFFMLDELIIFFIAVFTMRLWIFSGKTTNYIPLIQAIILFALGAFYLFGFEF